MDSLIKKLGLDEKQAAIYLALLELGTCSMTELSLKAKMKRPTCYLIVDQLLIMGLIKQVKKGKRKFYSAVHPKRLLEIAHNREREVKDVYSQLVSMHNSPKDKPRVHVFEFDYDDAVDEFYDEIQQWLEAGNEALFFTDIEYLHKFPESVKLYKKMLKKLDNPRIRELNFCNTAGIAWMKEIKSYQGKNHFVRLLPADFPYEGTDLLILGDKVVMCSLKKSIFIVSIESKDIADTQRAMFEWAWRVSLS